MVVYHDEIGIEALLEHHAPATLYFPASSILIGSGGIAYHKDGGVLVGGSRDKTTNDADDTDQDLQTFHNLQFNLFNKFLYCNELLFTSQHILQGKLAFSHLVLTSKGYERDLLGIGIRHLLLHLR